MIIENKIKELVKEAYWVRDENCCIALIKTISDIFSLDISGELISAAAALPGAGRFGAQCGLITGGIMIIGIIGKSQQKSNDEIRNISYNYSKMFFEKYYSLMCKELRPQGFASDNPPHLCEKLTVEAAIDLYKLIDSHK